MKVIHHIKKVRNTLTFSLKKILVQQHKKVLQLVKSYCDKPDTYFAIDVKD